MIFCVSSGQMCLCCRGQMCHFSSKCVKNHKANKPFSGQMCHFWPGQMCSGLVIHIPNSPTMHRKLNWQGPPKTPKNHQYYQKKAFLWFMGKGLSLVRHIWILFCISWFCWYCMNILIPTRFTFYAYFSAFLKKTHNE